MNILVFQGGKSLESEVSRLSAANAIPYLSKRHNVSLIDIDDNNSFTLNGEKITISIPDGFFIDGVKIPCDCAIPFTHGSFGEDGRLQSIFEYLNIPYVSCNPGSSYIGMDKDLQFTVLDNPMIETIPYIPQETDEKISQFEFEHIIDLLGDELIVKINKGGSSIGIEKIPNANRRMLNHAISILQEYDSKVIIQTLLHDIREFECAVWTKNGEIQVSNPCEIKTKYAFFDYDIKYNGKDETFKIDLNPNISKELIADIKDQAEMAFFLIGGEIYARVDFILDKDDNLYLNEINTLPGFTKTSHYPAMIENIMSLEDHFDILINEAIKRWEKNGR